MSLSPSARLGPYEILSAIGSGAMGDVYRASGTRLGRTDPSEGEPDRERTFAIPVRGGAPVTICSQY